MFVSKHVSDEHHIFRYTFFPVTLFFSYLFILKSIQPEILFWSAPFNFLTCARFWWDQKLCYECCEMREKKNQQLKQYLLRNVCKGIFTVPKRIRMNRNFAVRLFVVFTSRFNLPTLKKKSNIQSWCITWVCLKRRKENNAENHRVKIDVWCDVSL